MEKAQITVKNMRIHKRIPLTGSAHITFDRKDGDQSTDAIASNISLSGIGVYADIPIEDGTEVSIELHFISSSGEMVTETVTGTIVYAREMKDLYFTGIEFSEELTAENHKAIYDHIQQTLKWY
jgi:hypothetical protein